MDKPAETKIRSGYLIYFVFFCALALASVLDNFSSYPLAAAAGSAVSYLTASAGVLAYALRRSFFPKLFWVVYFFVFAAHFIAEGALDASGVQARLLLHVMTWGLGLVIFFPAFSAVFSLGFGQTPLQLLGTRYPRQERAAAEAVPAIVKTPKAWPWLLGILPVILLSTVFLQMLGYWGLRTAGLAAIRGYQQKHGDYPEKLSDAAALHAGGFIYEKFPGGRFRLTQKSAPFPAVYVFDSQEKKWTGGFYYGITAKLADFFALRCQKELNKKNYGKAFEAAELYSTLADFAHPSLRVVKGEALYWQAYLQKTAGDFHGALRSFEEAEEVFSVTSFRDPAGAFAFANQFGEVYVQFLDGESAEQYFQRVLNYAAENPKMDHPLIAEAYAGMGAAQALQKNYEEAVEDYHKAMEMYRKVPGDQSFSLTSCTQGLAGVYREWGRYEEAGQLYEKAQAMWARKLPETKLYLARLRQEMGYMEFLKKDYLKAEEHLRAAAGLFRDEGNVSLWDWAGSLNLLAMVLGQKGDKQEAVEIYEGLINDEDFVEAPGGLRFGPLTNLAQLHFDMNSYGKAVPLWKEAAEIASYDKEKEPDAYLQVQVKLAQTYAAMGDQKNAGTVIEEARALAKETKVLPETTKRLAEIIPLAAKGPD